MIQQIIDDCRESHLWPLCPSMIDGAQAQRQLLKQIQDQLRESQDRLFIDKEPKSFSLVFRESNFQNHCSYTFFLSGNHH